jgi:histidine triad (HIT) family protein
MEDIFCQIAEGKISSKAVYEDDKILAIDDIEPKAKIHIIIFPKKHIASTINEEDSDAVLGRIFKVARKIAKIKGVEESGYRVVTNHGSDSGQTVSHLHFHFLAGEKLKNI